MTELVRRLDRRQFDARVACFHRRGACLPHIESAVSEVAEFPIRSFRSPSTLLQFTRFARWCRTRRLAVVQAADIYANSFALPAAALAGVPLRVGSRREVHPSRGRGLEALQRAGYATAHRIVANSQAGVERLREEGISAERIVLVRNGLDLAAFRPRRARGGRRILSVGRLRPEKAHEVLIAAVARLRPAWPEVTLLLAGDGPREAALRQAVRDHHVSDCVTFLGHRDDVPALLGEADVFVLPSRIEASPNAVLEAMAAGLPVVACNVGGIPEAVTDGVTGLLVQPDDVESMAGAIAQVFASPAHANGLGLAARHYVEEHYSFGRMVGAFQNLYLTELSRRGYAAMPAPVNDDTLQTVTS